MSGTLRSELYRNELPAAIVQVRRRLWLNGCQCQEHPSLRPADVGDAVGEVPMFLVVEEITAPKIVDGPLKNLIGQREASFVGGAQCGKCDDGLGGAVDIDRIKTVVKVFGRAIGFKKVIQEVREPAVDRILELGGDGILFNIPKRAEVKSGVEVIDPFL